LEAAAGAFSGAPQPAQMASSIATTISREMNFFIFFIFAPHFCSDYKKTTTDEQQSSLVKVYHKNKNLQQARCC
jgi:hypothetical protein